MKTALKIVGALALAGIALAAVGTFVIYSGSYNVAATTSHSTLVHASLEKLMINSVRAHAAHVTVPPGVDLHDRTLAQGAVEHFQAMCVMCHGAPGHEPARWSQSLYPSPPDLTRALREHRWSDQEVFWIIKHGLKDTGMAAFGDSHSDRDLWALTALVRQFLEFSPEQYRKMVEDARSMQPTGHPHGSRGRESSPGHKH